MSMERIDDVVAQAEGRLAALYREQDACSITITKANGYRVAQSLDQASQMQGLMFSGLLIGERVSQIVEKFADARKTAKTELTKDITVILNKTDIAIVGSVNANRVVSRIRTRGGKRLSTAVISLVEGYNLQVQKEFSRRKSQGGRGLQ